MTSVMKVEKNILLITTTKMFSSRFDPNHNFILTDAITGEGGPAYTLRKKAKYLLSLPTNETIYCPNIDSLAEALQHNNKRISKHSLNSYFNKKRKTSQKMLDELGEITILKL